MQRKNAVLYGISLCGVCDDLAVGVVIGQEQGLYAEAARREKRGRLLPSMLRIDQRMMTPRETENWNNQNNQCLRSFD